MAKSARTQARDDEGRMPLVEHLRELRNRLAKGLLAIIVVACVAAYFYNDIINFFTDPILGSVGCKGDFTSLARTKGEACANVTMDGLIAPFSLALKVSLMAGVVCASPVWLYQLWAFVAPGLHRHEKKYALAFVGTGVPLFFLGALFAYEVLPTTAKVLLGFTPDHVANLLPLDELLDLVTRMVVVFGLSFEMPLLLVMLNFVGILSGKRMIGWWRIMIMGITVFAAVATPSTDPLSMLVLAGPIWVLYFAACFVALTNDRRKRRIEEAGPADDEASALDLDPEDVDTAPPITTPALPEQADAAGTHRVNGYDDVT
ncbi:twin-arginine translocase subunit TatC [Streptomyces montanisoli]|uniref:Sec-independent protein translocase protein TatC n=1 Tax=Streptomyces montanisoli TaxID=2798581 RepID=A0A940M6T3_9ACTN|nr:twin-arginine translocase subunit TatC [Streptomyces montanisoli]MBP0457244.1 twin-arginine translocase subunit TatC [Streptomyces montanisoli]